MLCRLVTVGKPSLPWARAGLDDYLGRLRRQAKVEHIAVREGPIQQVEKQLLKASEGCRRILLDERGTQRSSLQLAKLIEGWQLNAARHPCLIIGGADGHSDAMRASADELWSLSAMTLQHEMAAVLLIEQIYRAHQILAGSPYHRV